MSWTTLKKNGNSEFRTWNTMEFCRILLTSLLGILWNFASFNDNSNRSLEGLKQTFMAQFCTNGILWTSYILVQWWCAHSLLHPLNVPTHTFRPMYVKTQVQFVHYIIGTNPRIVPEFIIHPGHGGEPRLYQQYVHLLCDTSTYVFFVHFGSKCHNTLLQKTVDYATVHFLTVHCKTVVTERYVTEQYVTERYITEL